MSALKHRTRTHGLRIVILAGITVLTGACKDSGLPGKNLPQEQARRTEGRYPVYQVLPAAERPFEVDGRRWQVTAATEAIPTNMLVPVGAAGGTELLALRWDRAPFDQLYTLARGGRYSVVARLD